MHVFDVKDLTSTSKMSGHPVAKRFKQFKQTVLPFTDAPSYEFYRWWLNY
jgi:hypothetical protein